MPAPRPLRTRDFLTLVRDTTLPRLGDHLGHPQARVVFSSLQIHFGDPRLHYEVWPVRKTGRLEIGLHLEGPQDWSRALAARLAGHADELRRALGPDYELEDWTASWCRLHRTLPLEPLSPALADAVAARLAALIRVTEPLLRRLDPPRRPLHPRATPLPRRDRSNTAATSAAAAAPPPDAPAPRPDLPPSPPRPPPPRPPRRGPRWQRSPLGPPRS